MSRPKESVAETEFRAFVVRHQASLLRFALLISADPSTAEDLVQTALEKTYARWHRFRGEEPVAYARRIIANANIDRWRRTRGREQLTDRPPERPGGRLEEHVADRHALLQALQTLTVIERRVIALRFLADASESDTAQQLGIPLGTVKSVTHRALKKLRESGQLQDLDEVTS